MENQSTYRVMWLYAFVGLHFVLIGAMCYYVFSVLQLPVSDLKENWGSVALLLVAVVIVSGALIYDVMTSIKGENTGTIFRAKKLSENYYLIQKRHSLVPFWRSQNEVFTSQLHAEERARDLASRSN